MIVQHSMACEFPEGCSCGASDTNQLRAENEKLKAQLAATQSRLSKMSTDALTIMCRQDDAAESMALAAEAMIDDPNGPYVEAALQKAVAAWRAIRPTKGLVAGGAV